MIGTHSTLPILSAIQRFIKFESSAGILLICTACVAMLVANSPGANTYDAFINTHLIIQVSDFSINKPLLLWINDGLMAIFFFLVGLEIKREILEGELKTRSQITLPAIGAAGGMLVPAAIYLLLNFDDPIALDGWAIPVATDIAFALTVLSLFGNRVPVALKVFLLTLAIFDDLAAIILIALFYSNDLSFTALGVGLLMLILAVALNRLKITRTSPYILIGICLWVAVLKSGVHATVAGVLIALCIPMRDESGKSPLKELEHDLHGPVAFFILPLFAFANSGLSLGGISIDAVTHPVTLGVILGLVIGKPLGIMGFISVAYLLRLLRLPDGVSWPQIVGAACSCGIGFTMSLFIAGLAFEHGSGIYFIGDRLGILIGSVLSALIAWLVLHLSLPKKQTLSIQND